MVNRGIVHVHKSINPQIVGLVPRPIPIDDLEVTALGQGARPINDW